MEAESPPCPATRPDDTAASTTAFPVLHDKRAFRRLSFDHEEGRDSEDGNCTLHAFNLSSNITVIERLSDAASVSTISDLEHHSMPDPRSMAEAVAETEVEASERLLASLPCDGSDSGVEVAESGGGGAYRRTLSANSAASQDLGGCLTPARSCDSSILSCCSNYEEAYNILVRRNSTLLEDYTLRHEIASSEHGSEGSSVTGSSSSRNSKRTCQMGAKKKVSVSVSAGAGARGKATGAGASRERPNLSKPPTTPRLKSVDRAQAKAAGGGRTNSSKKTVTPSSLDLNTESRNAGARRDPKARPTAAGRAASTSRTPTAPTPTDDGRWPSINSRPAPLMSRSLRGGLPDTPRPSPADAKTIEKYATLPRRRKDPPADTAKDVKEKPVPDVQKKPTSRENSINRLAMPKRPTAGGGGGAGGAGGGGGARSESLPGARLLLSQVKRRQKVRIFHEAGAQTALDLADMDRLLAGGGGGGGNGGGGERAEAGVQADLRARDLELCRQQLRLLTDKYEALSERHGRQTEALRQAEERLLVEQLHREGLAEELKRNRERVMAMLGDQGRSGDGECSAVGGAEGGSVAGKGGAGAVGGQQQGGDGLQVLETRFRAAGQVVVRQEEEIGRLHAARRQLQLELERAERARRDLEAEGAELQEFLQAEKTTLADALREAEVETERWQRRLAHRDLELREKQEECQHLVRLSEQRRQENLGLQARLGALEAKSRELLVHQGSSVSGASVALSALIGRLDGLVEELVSSYSISEQELEDIIFHNEAYSNSSSSPDATPERMRKLYMDRTPSPKKGSSFVSAVINAIKNAAAQSPFAALKDNSKDGLCTEHSSSNEMLDSETEPCLMMEHVLEDVVVPDGHSHNMISSGHGMLGPRLNHSESLKDLSQAILNRQLSEQMSASYAGSLTASFTGDLLSLTEIFPSISLIDQVIDVDNLITRLLKVIRIIQLENDDSMNELHEQRDSLAEQVDKQKETNKVVVKQLKDWEVLGSRLKAEVKELMQQLSKKNTEIDKIKTELNNQREQVEKLNQDVCELSTALAKAELEKRTKEEEVTEALRKWEKSGESPTPEILEKLIVSHGEVPALKEKLVEKERHLNELTQEFLASRQVLTESLKDAVSEAKKQYQTIDNALEVLHSIQSVVQQCQPLAQLQRELEETSFKSASKIPLSAHPDCNANAGLLQAVTNLEIAAPINTTA